MQLQTRKIDFDLYNDHDHDMFSSQVECALLKEFPYLSYHAIILSNLILVIDNSYLKESKFRRKPLQLALDQARNLVGFIISVRMNKAFANNYGGRLQNQCSWFFILNTIDAGVGIFFMLFIYKVVQSLLNSVRYKFELGNYGTRQVFRSFFQQVFLWMMINLICKSYMKFILSINTLFVEFTFGWMLMNESLCLFLRETLHLDLDVLCVVILLLVYIIIFVQTDFYIFGFLSIRKLDESSIICNISDDIEGSEEDSLLSDVDSTKRIQFINKRYDLQNA